MRAPDPLWEIVLSLQMLRTRPHGPAFEGWRRQAFARIGERRGPLAETLGALVPAIGYVPDFLTPVDASLGLDEGVEAVLSTPTRRMRRELTILAKVNRLPPWSGDLATGNRKAVAGLGDSLRAYYRHALAPIWQRIQTRVAADRAIRTQALLDGGPERLLASLSPHMRWEAPVLRVNYPADRDLHLTGRGLLLIPSYFCQHIPTGIADPALPPVLVYPVHPGESDPAPRHTSAALQRLLGTTRAQILAATQQGRSTGELARLLRISPATVSHHTAVLREAGLIESRRQANVVVHTTTPLGLSLPAGMSPEALRAFTSLGN